MMRTITLCVRGIPKGQPRQRHAISKHASVKTGKRFIMNYDPGTADAWKTAVKAAIREHVPKTPHACPMQVSETFYMPRPQALCKKSCVPGPIPHTAKPDRDNLEKATLDAITDSGFWRDDSQVYGGNGPWKFYHAIDGAPGAVIEITFDDGENHHANQGNIHAGR